MAKRTLSLGTISPSQDKLLTGSQDHPMTEKHFFFFFFFMLNRREVMGTLVVLLSCYTSDKEPQKVKVRSKEHFMVFTVTTVFKALCMQSPAGRNKWRTCSHRVAHCCALLCLRTRRFNTAMSTGLQTHPGIIIVRNHQTVLLCFTSR